MQIASDASDEVKKKGVTLDGKKNPAAQIWKDNPQSALQIEQYFEKILKNTVPKKKDEDPLAEFQAKGKKLEAMK